MIVSIVNEKGGSGKSTLAVNLASSFSKGNKVLLLDTDPQNSINVFSNIRADNDLPLIFSSLAKFGSSLKEELKNLKKLFEIIIIDTSGRDTKDARFAMLSSNIIIIPAIPSQFDVDVLEHMLNIFDEVKILNEKLKGFVLANRVSPNPFLSKEVQSLNEYTNELIKEKSLKDFYLLESIIYERQAYRRAILEGKSLDEFCKQGEKALFDFNAFFKEFTKKIKD